ncbi:hypothetical protein LWI28_027727 [Acer negundo]|uniref:Uncharacterized protein n=1 Tax=Acer negundo TaxID=4023 RepID=A0AAD5J1N4_ACENE|nr:hypothetical protein LWI28_027727 [Acer negundo]
MHVEGVDIDGVSGSLPEMVFSRVGPKSAGGRIGSNGLCRDDQRQSLSGVRKGLKARNSRQVEVQNLSKIDSEILHEVAVMEVSGPIGVDMDGKLYKTVPDEVVCNLSAVTLNLKKKKGKWKRCTREGGQKDSEPEKGVQVDKKRISMNGLSGDFSNVKKLKMENAFYRVDDSDKDEDVE